MTIKIDGTEKNFIVDTKSPATIIPPDNKKIKNKEISPILRKYQDVNTNAVKFVGKITVEAESRGNTKNMTMLITE